MISGTNEGEAASRLTHVITGKTFFLKGCWTKGLSCFFFFCILIGLLNCNKNILFPTTLRVQITRSQFLADTFLPLGSLHRTARNLVAGFSQRAPKEQARKAE